MLMLMLLFEWFWEFQEMWLIVSDVTEIVDGAYSQKRNPTFCYLDDFYRRL
jgi:hypothetical protein